MKRGFTIIELLVASLLLGMLVSILTMMFNQSSIAWRTGVAGIEDLDTVRQNIAELRDEADNAYVWGNEVHRIVGLWDNNGDLRDRAWDAEGSKVEGESDGASSALMLKGKLNDTSKLGDISALSVGSGQSTGSVKTYVVNVKSKGPDGDLETYDDIWSNPNEIKTN